MGSTDAIETRLKEDRRFEPSTVFRNAARVQSPEQYKKLYDQSLADPEGFWREQTKELVWQKTWSKFSEWDLPKAKFFAGAKLNVSESCLDRHLATENRTKAAIVFEGEPGDSRTLTYFELHREVVRLSAALLDLGVKAGDRIAIYMGMLAET